MSDWSQEMSLQFLEAFQSEPVIWDPKHPGHKDRKKVHDAWVRLQGLIGKPIKEIKAKKDSLMATYRGYCRKISASIKSGASADEVYKPVWFAFEFMDQFMGSVYSCGSSVNTEEVNNTSEIVVDDSNPLMDNEIKSELQNDEQEEQFDNFFPNPTSTSSTAMKTVHQRADPPKLQHAADQMKSAFDTLNNVLRKKNDADDEYDLFGKLIAKRLKRLPQHEREDIMFDIERVFHNRRFQNRRPPSTSYNNYSLSSHSQSSSGTAMLLPDSKSSHSSSQHVQPKFQSIQIHENNDLIHQAYMNI